MARWCHCQCCAAGWWAVFSTRHGGGCGTPRVLAGQGNENSPIQGRGIHPGQLALPLVLLAGPGGGVNSSTTAIAAPASSPAVQQAAAAAPRTPATQGGM